MAPLASKVPQDAPYVHLPDPTRAARLIADLIGRLAPATQALERRPGRWHLVDRYTEQPAIVPSGMAKRLGGGATNLGELYSVVVVPEAGE
ncbi:MAG: hypothetical protein ACQEXJ_15475 [Myxococcota bacterium]